MSLILKHVTCVGGPRDGYEFFVQQRDGKYEPIHLLPLRELSESQTHEWTHKEIIDAVTIQLLYLVSDTPEGLRAVYQGAVPLV